MAKRTKNSVGTSAQWDALFHAVNTQAIKTLGEAPWAAIVEASGEHLKSAGVVVDGRREKTILALGMWMGTQYILQLANATLPKEERKGG